MPNEREIWNDSMAYLSGNDNTDASMINNQGKPLLKCGFVVTGCPKKIWALKIRNCSIEEDDLNNKWFQIGNDMLLTKQDDLLKYRMSVQCAVEFGIDKVIPKANLMTNENSPMNLETIDTDDRTDTTTIEVGEFCCASILCGKAKETTTYIEQSMICHRCCICRKAMHGGICGAEAATILLATECTSTSVICFLCIQKKVRVFYYLIWSYKY
jgi:hypothetical protein